VSNRIVRINELVQRELNDILRRRYQTEAVAMTVTEVRVAPDLRDARVFVAIVGGDEVVQEQFRWLRRQAPALRAELARRIILKYLPRFEYVLDESTVRGARVMQVLDQIVPPAAEPPAEP
jgi:ribosome-binding factor A